MNCLSSDNRGPSKSQHSLECHFQVLRDKATHCSVIACVPIIFSKSIEDNTSADLLLSENIFCQIFGKRYRGYRQEITLHLHAFLLYTLS